MLSDAQWNQLNRLLKEHCSIAFPHLQLAWRAVLGETIADSLAPPTTMNELANRVIELFTSARSSFIRRRSRSRT